MTRERPERWHPSARSPGVQVSRASQARTRVVVLAERRRGGVRAARRLGRRPRRRSAAAARAARRPQRRRARPRRRAPASGSGPSRRPRRACAPAPTGTPISASRGSSVRRRVRRRRRPRAARSPARGCATRSAFVASPSASGSSPKPAQNRRHSPSLPTLSCTAPSAQWKSPYGQIDGWWLPCARPDLAGHGVARCPGRRARRRSPRAATCGRPGPAGARPLVQRGEHAVGAVHPGEQVADRHADTLRVVRSGPGQRHEAAFALGDLVVARPAALGAVVAEPARSRGSPAAG